MKKHYCIVSAQYLPTMGGVENYSFNLAKTLIKNGHRCTIITSSLPNCPEYETDENGIEIIRLDSYNFLNNRFPFVKFSKKNKTRLKNLLEYKNLRFIINTRIYPLSLFTSRFCYKYNISSFIIEHGSYYLSFNNKLVDFIIKIYEHTMLALIKKYCKDFYGVSNASCEWLLNFNISTSNILNNAIDIKKIDLISKKHLNLSELNLNNDSKIICYVGRFIPEKGVDKLMTAFNELSLKNTYLLFAGEGYLREHLIKNKNKNTIILNKLNFNEVINLFKNSDIFCLPTISEGFPTTVLEASACGCYTITTLQSGGATELISDESYGYLMEDNSVENIKKALLKALSDNDLKIKANNAKEKVLKNYTWDVTAKKIEDLN